MLDRRIRDSGACGAARDFGPCPSPTHICDAGGAQGFWSSPTSTLDPAVEEVAGHHVELTDQLFISVIDAAPDGIVVVDDQEVIALTNPMAAQMFGYSADELVGQPIEVLLPDRLRAGHAAHRDGYIRHPRTRAMGSGLDLRGRRRSGEEFPVEIALSPVRLSDRTLVTAIVRDITERRAADAALMRAHQELALVDDRERIARDLHDTVIQRLFAVGLSLQGALGGSSLSRVTERVEGAIDEIDGTIRDIRTSIFSLHARRMPTAGLRDDVLATAREAGRALAFEPHVVFDGPIDAATPDSVREHLVPTLREALSNVVKHASASHVSVSLTIASGELLLQVVDDGIGVPADGAHGGRGLGNMTERALALGGRCEIRPGDGGGTLFEWHVPLKSRA
jgi:PAS domain S-box-containing protein